ncbi:MAG: ATP-binding cassette domain-containing protein [Calditrichaeota bacterium]|nr:MAG: ATP-binding cassette domain-containing protein [Calditrichota bacterium]
MDNIFGRAMKVVEFENVSLCLNGKQILSNVSFSIEKNETVLLVGSSGSGKSTILRLILALQRPSSGTIRVMGQDLTGFCGSDLLRLRQKIGLVFQEGALFDSHTVLENVCFFLVENLHVPLEEARERVLPILEFLGLHEYMHYYPSELSGGMKKRVGIARAIASKPELVLYDEPTAGLDPISAKKVVELIDTLDREYGVTSLIVTHELHYFVDAVDRLLFLKNGQIVYSGVPEVSILEQYSEPEVKPACS